MPQTSDGSIRQSAHHFDEMDYNHKRMMGPVLGVVLSVIPADNPDNRSAAFDRNQRGTRCEAKVLVINDGLDTPWILPNVVIAPTGSSGCDNFTEELPRGCSFVLNGGTYNTSLAGVDVEKLDGDFVLVSFIGGNIGQPVMTSWFPHPFNSIDPATAGVFSEALNQGRRFFKRFQGAKLIITNKGTVVLDTTESGSEIKGDPGGPKRVLKDPGGDILINIKKTKKLDINFNTPVIEQTEPSIPGPVKNDGSPADNPPISFPTREDALTRLSIDKDLVELVAGEVVRILTRTDNIEILAKKIVKIIGDQGDSSIELGNNPDDFVTKGQLHQVMHATLASYINTVASFLGSHSHPVINAQPIAPGPVITGSPSGSPPSSNAPTMPNNNISTVVRVK